MPDIILTHNATAPEILFLTAGMTAVILGIACAWQSQINAK